MTNESFAPLAEGRCECECGLRGCAARNKKPARVREKLSEEALRERARQYSLAKTTKNQQITQATADRKGQPWTSEELDLLLREDLTAMQIAKMIGRTYRGVRTMRERVKVEPKLQRVIEYKGHQESI